MISLDDITRAVFSYAAKNEDPPNTIVLHAKEQIRLLDRFGDRVEMGRGRFSEMFLHIAGAHLRVFFDYIPPNTFRVGYMKSFDIETKDEG